MLSGSFSFGLLCSQQVGVFHSEIPVAKIYSANTVILGTKSSASCPLSSITINLHLYLYNKNEEKKQFCVA
jgi:hypothetical protein